jgi:hypothetical protein
MQSTNVDEIRTAIASGNPVTLGINWYVEMDDPVKVGSDWWIAKDKKLTTIRGGHAICCYGASDRRQAFKLVNSWGLAFPTVWIPYEVVQRLINEEGEGCLISDR